jgi:hypothetical protein
MYTTGLVMAGVYRIFSDALLGLPGLKKLTAIMKLDMRALPFSNPGENVRLFKASAKVSDGGSGVPGRGAISSNSPLELTRAMKKYLLEVQALRSGTERYIG